MTAAHRRYIAIEALIGATISAVLSVAFVLLISGHGISFLSQGAAV